MPRFDGTGPYGKGNRTGRGLGNCNQARNLSSGQSNFNINDLEQRVEKLEDQIEKIKKQLDM